jgi:NitT/TauT family transport system ATP-binding protein
MSHSTEQASLGHIEARDVGIRFQTRTGSMEAVQSVSLHVAPGEFVSLIGPSGCGKSTLLNAVAGFIEPSAGTLTVDGKGIHGPGPDRGVVFQQYSLFPWMTVRKNVEFGLKMHGMQPMERERQARTLLGLAGLLSTPISCRAA